MKCINFILNFILYYNTVHVTCREEKKKAKLKDKEKEEQDDFSSGSEDSGPDLSWLPDPDKVYGKKTSDDDNSGQEVYEKSHGSESDSDKAESKNIKDEPSPARYR